MTNFANEYADTIRFTVDQTKGGTHQLHCWFSDETAYLPIRCATKKILKLCITAIQASCIEGGNVKPVLSA